MTREEINFSPVTRLSGLLSVDVVIDNLQVVEANVKGNMFRGYEEIMGGRQVRDAVYMTQRVCGICSLAHGAAGSYLLDELYGNQVSETAQYLRNIMYGADFLQNHIRHFYLFSLPDFVDLPDKPPFQDQNLTDARLNPEENQRLIEHYYDAIEASQESHQILALFGGKAPEQHSFLDGGVAVAPTVDKINQAMSLVDDIYEFVTGAMLPDTQLIADVYSDYFDIGVTPKRLLSFGLFRFGPRNEELLWEGGILEDNNLTSPELDLIEETVVNSWFEDEEDGEVEPNPYKPYAYSWIKTVQYGGEFFETGPLARMLINGFYEGGTSTMDRILARTIETVKIAALMKEWLERLNPQSVAPINQNQTPVKSEADGITGAMRGGLLHSASIQDEEVVEYDIITPTVWNFAPKDRFGSRGPVENAIVGTEIPREDEIYTVLGRIIRSFDPCISCGTHVLDSQGNLQGKKIFGPQMGD